MNNEYFKPAGDLNDTIKPIHNKDEETYIKDYLLEIVSGENLNSELEDIIIIGGGSMIVSFNDLQKMVDEGCYNFIKAEYLNPEMVIVEYEKYRQNNIITK